MKKQVRLLRLQKINNKKRKKTKKKQIWKRNNQWALKIGNYRNKFWDIVHITSA